MLRGRLLLPQPARAAALVAPPDDRRARLHARAARRHGRLRVRVERLSARLAVARFTAFVVGAACLFAGWYDRAWGLYGPIAAVAWGLFAAAVALHRRPFFLGPRCEALAAASGEDAARSRGDWAALPDGGADFLDAARPELAELQIFGGTSLFALLSRATLPAGRARLAEVLREGLPLDEIGPRQAAAVELAGLRLLRRRVLAEGRLVKVDEAAMARFLAWAEAPADDRWLRPVVALAAVLVPASWVQVVLSVGLGVPTAWQLCFGAQVVLYMLTTRRISAGYLPLLGDGRAQPFVALRRMFARVEGRRWRSEVLQAMQARLRASGAPPSARMLRLERVLEALAVRHGALLYSAVSLGLLWEIFQGARLERWRARHGALVRADLAALADFEAMASVGAFAADHPGYAWPQLREADPVFAARRLGHPLFPAGAREHNDFTVPSGGQLVLVTGSNMSGKSSFLRTLGANTRLALAGAPVCAEAMEMIPCGLSTSIQVVDAPEQGMSRFYAEVRRIAGVLRAVESADGEPGELPRLYLIDEMLSGTNSRERHLACRAIVRRLVAARGSFGLVTTHDLELVGVARELPDNVALYHFADRFDGQVLHFDYQLRPGVATTTNALHVLRMEGIDVPEG